MTADRDAIQRASHGLRTAHVLRQHGTGPAASRGMMDTVKNAFHTIGDRGGEFARTIGCETADFAKRVGSSTADIAKRVGPKRGLIGLAVLAVAIGGSIVLVRYLRSRDEETREGLDEELGGEETVRGGRRNRRRSQASYTASQTVR